MQMLSFRARIGRGGFIGALLFWYVWGCLWLFVGSISLFNLGSDLPKRDRAAVSFLRSVRVSTEVASIGEIVALLGMLALCVGIVALSVRRLHDMNASGFVILIFFALNWLVPDQPNWPLFLPQAGALIWFALMTLIPGTSGENKFGPDPYVKRSEAVKSWFHANR